MKYFFTFCLFFYSAVSWCQKGVRVTCSENDAWQFTKERYPIDDSLKSSGVQWQNVHLPHTWNADDVMDDVPGYFRGVCWYRKKITVSNHFKNKQVFLYFEGANQETEIFINGKKAGEHIGGYTAFCIPISKYLISDEKNNQNEIVVKVDNSHNPNVPPLSADFTFFGGIYRDVYLMAVDPVHFTFTDGAVQGVFISTPYVDAQKATIHITGSITNTIASRQAIKVTTQVFDKQRNRVAQAITKLTVIPGDLSFEQDIRSIVSPRLWSPEDPYLYTVVTTISDAASGLQLDEVTNPLGFRWFHFDAENGFFLNGQPYKLIGVSRHQDFKQKGNALPDEMAWNDLEWLKKMGGNFLRIAHYPQDPSILAACDRLGILASVEIPVVNEITETDIFYHNCQQMQREMIRQHYNHPSIVLWCYMNEILLKSHFNDDQQRQTLYYRNILKLAKDLDSMTRKEDPFRYTMIANHGDFERYHRTGLTSVPGVIGWNLYQGWYGGQLVDFSSFLDHHHQALPGRPFLISEYGADADPRIRSLYPERFDKSVEYTTAFHQYYLEAVRKRPFVSGAIVWNLADFNSEGREESMPHINNKGLLTWDRIAKDPYYFYQAQLTKRPFLKISSEYWKQRAGVADSSDSICHQPIQVATNLDSVTFILNGCTVSTQKVMNGMCSCLVPFQNGINTLEVRGIQEGKLYWDRTEIHFNLIPRNLRDEHFSFPDINILLGAKRYFIDDELQQTWIPNQIYQPGSWGSVGGKPFKMAGSSRLPYGTDKNIVGTNNDPIYQTQQIGIEQYRLDVPDGVYELTLHFAELQGAQMKSLVYNLTQSNGLEKSEERIFHVFVNEVMVLENFNLASQYGVAQAVAKKVRVSVHDQSGITIRFSAVKGEPVLNALQVRKIF